MSERPRTEPGSSLWDAPRLRDAEFRARVREARAALLKGDSATAAYLRGETADPMASAAAILEDDGAWTKGDALVVAHAFALLVAAVGDAGSDV